MRTESGRAAVLAAALLIVPAGLLAAGVPAAPPKNPGPAADPAKAPPTMADPAKAPAPAPGKAPAIAPSKAPTPVPPPARESIPEAVPASGLSAVEEGGPIRLQGTLQWGGERPEFLVEPPPAAASDRIIILHETAALEAFLKKLESELPPGSNKAKAGIKVALRIYRCSGRFYGRFQAPPASAPAVPPPGGGPADGSLVRVPGELDLSGPRPALRVVEGALQGQALTLQETASLEAFVASERPPQGKKPDAPGRYWVVGRIGRFKERTYLQILYSRKKEP